MKNRPMRTFFDPSEQKQILSLRKQGLSIRNISKKLHRSRVNIAAFLNDPDSYQKLMAEAANASSPAAAPKTPVKTPKEIEAKKKPASTSTTPSKTKTPKKFSKSPAAQSSTKKTPITNKDLAEYNKVKMEHRSVIKFLIRLGEHSHTIYAQLKKAYKPAHPEMAAVIYWAKQFRKGRQTILNDKETTQRLMKVQNCKVLVSKAKASTIKKMKKPKPAEKKAKTAKKTSLQNGKDAMENGSEKEDKKFFEISTGPFTIKLPGMDRISKALT